MMTYWTWLLRGSDRPAGIRRFLDGWLVVHAACGLLLAWAVPLALKDAANTVLLPLAGVFVGLSFAWGGNAQALLQTDEIEELADRHAGGIEEYAYVYQTAILEVMAALALWGFAGLSIFDETWPTKKSPVIYFGIRALVFGFTSLTLRECWHVVLGAQSLLVLRRSIRKHRREASDGSQR